MKNAVFIIPYFGRFNNYFQLFLNSCKYNEDFNWLIFTDDKTNYDYPSNVQVEYMTFDNLKKIIKNKFKNAEIKLNAPYKLCDLKPMYGYIFQEYIKDYKYWGFCDVDLIFGKINNFINLDKLAKDDYKKIGFLGHFTLFKNEKFINEIFMCNNKYLDVLNHNKIYKFDEEFDDSINNIFKDNNLKIFEKDYYADIYVKSSNFKLTHFNIKKNLYEVEKKDKSFFVWNKGRLFKYIQNNKKIVKKEYLYIHLQKRQMKLNLDNFDIYKIIPNAFDNLEIQLLESNKIKKIKKKNFNLHYFKIRSKNLKLKILKRIKGEE